MVRAYFVAQSTWKLSCWYGGSLWRIYWSRFLEWRSSYEFSIPLVDWWPTPHSRMGRPEIQNRKWVVPLVSLSYTRPWLMSLYTTGWSWHSIFFLLLSQCYTWVDGVVGYRICLTGLIPTCTEGPQFEPGSTHLPDILMSSHRLNLGWLDGGYHFTC